MPGLTITLSFRWPMGHRILNLPSAQKCANVHGHNWQADIELPNNEGRLEFGAVKTLIGAWIEDYWDHGMLVEWSDPFRAWLETEGLKFDYLPVPPTTEAIAAELARKATELIGVTPARVHVMEGWRNAATWTP